MSAGEVELHIVLERPGTGDSDAMWPVHIEAFRALIVDTYGEFDEAELRKRWLWDWDDDVRMIRLDGRAVGYLRLQTRSDHDWLDLIVVAERGRGIGTAVIERLVADAHHRGVALRLSVYRNNAARRLYQRLGFEEEPTDDPIRIRMRRAPPA